ncbi:hypothetical protein AZE42_00179 [Rhizopogon vesiculosus]|uniref:Uncharacterized protein n=1 Tax=Rhizopogon vesiculosus TaxID=180088 RepID=A0A1J8Q6A2_9AGAM|nr:hypothetical protein AZE42_00179 [Rhizopogon vesiculosus]
MPPSDWSADFMRLARLGEYPSRILCMSCQCASTSSRCTVYMHHSPNLLSHYWDFCQTLLADSEPPITSKLYSEDSREPSLSSLSAVRAAEDMSRVSRAQFFLVFHHEIQMFNLNRNYIFVVPINRTVYDFLVPW